MQTIVSGLTYDVDILAMIINYGMIAATLASFLLDAVAKRSKWIICLVVSLIIQMLLWFVADAIGVSIVWCTMGGFLALTYWNKGSERHPFVIGVLLTTVAVIVYYAITYPIITTIAHVLAIIVGILIYLPTQNRQLTD
jgi:hypothetical protein